MKWKIWKFRVSLWQQYFQRKRITQEAKKDINNTAGGHGQFARILTQRQKDKIYLLAAITAMAAFLNNMTGFLRFVLRFPGSFLRSSTSIDSVVASSAACCLKYKAIQREKHTFNPFLRNFFWHNLWCLHCLTTQVWGKHSLSTESLSSKFNFTNYIITLKNSIMF